MIKRNIIVVGTSAGGVQTLCDLTKYLPQDLDASIFIVMHIGSETMLPEILSSRGNLPAVIAEHGKELRTRPYLLRAGELPPVN
jgi:two-component system, chemotaxis family, protein-glutamate methylesterase/glutaminase